MYDPVAVGAFLAWIAGKRSGRPVEFTVYRNPAMVINSLRDAEIMPAETQYRQTLLAAEVFRGRAKSILSEDRSSESSVFRLIEEPELDSDGLPVSGIARDLARGIFSAAEDNQTLRFGLASCVPEKSKDVPAWKYAALELTETTRAFLRGMRVKAGHKRERCYDEIFRKVLSGDYPCLSGLAKTLNPASAPNAEIFGTAYWDEEFAKLARKSFSFQVSEALDRGAFNEPTDEHDLAFFKEHPDVYRAASMLAGALATARPGLSPDTLRHIELELRMAGAFPGSGISGSATLGATVERMLDSKTIYALARRLAVEEEWNQFSDPEGAFLNDPLRLKKILRNVR